MRRTDDHLILKMKEEGKTGKEIADFFGVSDAYICKRLKRLKPVKEPESFEKLTDKEKKFVLAKVEGKTNVDAAMTAFDVSSRFSAKSLGYNLMKAPDIGKAIQDIMAEEGLTRRYIIQRLKYLVDHPDGHVVAKGIDMANKMTGEYAPVKVDSTIDINALKQNIIISQAEIDRLDRLRIEILNRFKGVVEVDGENGKEGD